MTIVAPALHGIDSAAVARFNRIEGCVQILSHFQIDAASVLVVTQLIVDPEGAGCESASKTVSAALPVSRARIDSRCGRAVNSRSDCPNRPPVTRVTDGGWRRAVRRGGGRNNAERRSGHDVLVGAWNGDVTGSHLSSARGWSVPRCRWAYP